MARRQNTSILSGAGDALYKFSEVRDRRKKEKADREERGMSDKKSRAFQTFEKMMDENPNLFESADEVQQVLDEIEKTGRIPKGVNSRAEGPTTPGEEPPTAFNPIDLFKQPEMVPTQVFDPVSGNFTEGPSFPKGTETFRKNEGPQAPRATEASIDREERRKSILAMLKGAKNTKQINIGGNQTSAEYRDEITNALLSAGIDPSSDEEMSAIVGDFPEREPSKFAQSLGKLFGTAKDAVVKGAEKGVETLSDAMSGGSSVAAAAPKGQVIVEKIDPKTGKKARFYLPQEQLEAATKQGYKLVK